MSAAFMKTPPFKVGDEFVLSLSIQVDLTVGVFLSGAAGSGNPREKPVTPD
jgi:hypothetical protein